MGRRCETSSLSVQLRMLGPTLGVLFHTFTLGGTSAGPCRRMPPVRDVVAVRAATRVHVRMPVHGVPCQLPPGVYPVVNMACHVHVYYPVTREGRDAGGSTAKNMCNQADLDDAGAPCNSLNSFKESLSRPSHGRAGQAPCPQTCGDAQREKGMANYSVCDRDVRAKRRALPQRNWSLECGSRGARP